MKSKSAGGCVAHQYLVISVVRISAIINNRINNYSDFSLKKKKQEKKVDDKTIKKIK